MKKRRMFIKRICCLSFCAVLMFAGCGKSEMTVEEAIELVDPVSVSTGSAVVERRNIYDYKVYAFEIQQHSKNNKMSRSDTSYCLMAYL